MHLLYNVMSPVDDQLLMNWYVEDDLETMWRMICKLTTHAHIIILAVDIFHECMLYKPGVRGYLG